LGLSSYPTSIPSTNAFSHSLPPQHQIVMNNNSNFFALTSLQRSCGCTMFMSDLLHRTITTAVLQKCWPPKTSSIVKQLSF